MKYIYKQNKIVSYTIIFINRNKKNVFGIELNTIKVHTEHMPKLYLKSDFRIYTEKRKMSKI